MNTKHRREQGEAKEEKWLNEIMEDIDISKEVYEYESWADFVRRGISTYQDWEIQ